jgi:leader peptidase (prepilin peptidase) / N-methyltransferase
MAADAATVTAAAVAGLLAGGAASRLVAGLLAAPRPAEPPAAEPPAAEPPAAEPPAGEPPAGSPPAGRGTRWSLSLGTGLACAVMAIRFGPSPALPAFCYLAGIGVPLAMIDARCQRLPDALTLPSYPVALALLGFAALLLPGGAGHFLGALAGLGLACGIFLLQVLLYPAGLGWGDVKLSGLLGLYLGWLSGGGLSGSAGWLDQGTLVAGLFLGYLFAAAAGLALIAARRASRKSRLPFGPYLLAGTLTAIVLSSLITASGR